MARTYSDLVDDDHNMLVQVKWPDQQRSFFEYLEHEREAIEQIVAYHLSLRPHEQCKVAPRKDWLCGSFNVCIPVTVDAGHRVLIRCPLPHRFASLTSADMADEKIRGEAATSAWLASRCPNIPVPRLWGFGLSNGRSFIPVTHCSWLRQAYEWIRWQAQKRFWNVDYCRPFLPATIPVLLKTGYLITDFVERHQGAMLNLKWPTPNSNHRRTLYRGLANILLDLIHLPQLRIGSFTVHDTGEVTLGGRPLTAALASLEAQGIRTDIFPATTYASVDTYMDDLLHCHDTRLRDQPNAVEEANDALGQMATVVVLKAVRSHFFSRKFREGPFFLQLTDLHGGNIFVDDEYNITAVVDLEFCCSLPLELQQLPFWISGHTEGDDFLGDDAVEHENAFIEACEDFLKILREEQSYRTSPGLSDAEGIIRAALGKKLHWYFAAVTYPRTAYSFLVTHLQSVFAPSHVTRIEEAATFQETFAPYYIPSATEFMNRKLEEKSRYNDVLFALTNDRKSM